jgi:hypothetical protein
MHTRSLAVGGQPTGATYAIDPGLPRTRPVMACHRAQRIHRLEHCSFRSGSGTKRSGTKRSGTKRSGTKRSGTKRSGTKRSGWFVRDSFYRFPSDFGESGCQETSVPRKRKKRVRE